MVYDLPILKFKNNIKYTNKNKKFLKIIGSIFHLQVVLQSKETN